LAESRRSEPRRPDTPFWVERGSVEGDRLRLSPEESHHLLHVHRAAAGAPFQAIDGNGVLYDCVLDSVEGRAAVGRIVRRSEDVGELRVSIHLLVGMPDWGAVEAVVATAVPLGAGLLDFVVCERSSRGPLGAERLERLRRLAQAGLKQSRRTRLTEIRSSASLEPVLASLPPGPRYIADPHGEPWHPIRGESIQEIVTLTVGPPGGFSDGEREALRLAGFLSISLGPNRLSTETACLAFLSLARNLL
jgi:16S rRNA (uracil1498-N3)-methyltransferase